MGERLYHVARLRTTGLAQKTAGKSRANLDTWRHAIPRCSGSPSRSFLGAVVFGSLERLFPAVPGCSRSGIGSGLSPLDGFGDLFALPLALAIRTVSATASIVRSSTALPVPLLGFGSSAPCTYRAGHNRCALASPTTCRPASVRSSRIRFDGGSAVRQRPEHLVVLGKSPALRLAED
jgi:hypothetical protein